jgi:REP element-mobilizing transposase RayT
MPDHLHTLVEALSDDSALLKFVTMFKQRTAFEYRRATGKRLWQEGYYDRVVRDYEPVFGIAAYILHNPIRAQLCTRVSDYPFLGSDRYTIAELIDSVQFRPGGSRP